MAVWYETRCVRCVRKLVVPVDVAERVNARRSFVMCVPCADDWQGNTEASDALRQLRPLLHELADDDFTAA